MKVIILKVKQYYIRVIEAFVTGRKVHIKHMPATLNSSTLNFADASLLYTYRIDDSIIKKKKKCKQVRVLHRRLVVPSVMHHNPNPQIDQFIEEKLQQITCRAPHNLSVCIAAKRIY